MYKLYYDESDWNTTSISPYGDGSGTIVREPLNSIRIAVLGDYAVGKTSLIKRLCLGEDFRIEQHKTTVSVDLYSTVLGIDNGSRKIKLEIYDTPSMDQYKANVGTFYQSCHGAAIVYDTTEPYSFSNIPQQVDNVRRCLPPYAELFLIGAKSDLTEERKVTFKEADIFATKNNLSLFETSSKTNSGVQGTFCRITESIVERFEIGTFDPSTLVVPALANKVQVNGEVTRGIVRPNWSLMCCWL